jgi:hypothetical protein
MTESFCREDRCSEEMDLDPDTGEATLAVTKTFYPNPSASRSEIENAHHLPVAVHAIYREALAAHAAQLPISVGFAVRAIIEAVCIDKQIPGYNLEQKIDGLAAAGLITADSAKILHSLRFMGNAAAHQIKAHKAQELGTALDIADILLQNVYVLPQLANKLPKK